MTLTYYFTFYANVSRSVGAKINKIQKNQIWSSLREDSSLFYTVTVFSIKMPSMKVEGDSDGDGDMSGGDTERSGGSSRGPDRDSSAEEADEPDSDDSSEMDESECERRRNECLDNLG